MGKNMSASEQILKKRLRSSFKYGVLLLPVSALHDAYMLKLSVLA